MQHETYSADECEIKIFPTFNKVLDHYRGLFNGKRNGEDTPGGIIEDETIPLFPYLLKMNEAGIMTTCSQPGIITKEGPGVIYKQRAFVDCFMYPSLLPYFFRNSEKMRGITVLVAPALHKKESADFEDLINLSVAEREGEETEVYICFSAGLGTNDLDMVLEENVKERVLKELVHVFFVDMQWGREKYLFEVVSECVEKKD